jgi:hypothetical protein
LRHVPLTAVKKNILTGFEHGKWPMAGRYIHGIAGELKSKILIISRCRPTKIQVFQTQKAPPSRASSEWNRPATTHPQFV